MEKHAMEKKLWLRPAAITACLLSLPLLMTVRDHAKPIGEGWHWGPGDFGIMAALLMGAGLAYEAIARRLRLRTQRIVLAAATVAVVSAIWVELAVGGVSQLLAWLG